MQPCSHCVALAGSSQALQHIWEPRVTVREPERAGSTPNHGGAMSAVSQPLPHVPCGLDALADLPSPSTRHWPTHAGQETDHCVSSAEALWRVVAPAGLCLPCSCPWLPLLVAAQHRPAGNEEGLVPSKAALPRPDQHLP